LEAIEKKPDYCQVLVIDDVPSFYDYCLWEVRSRLKLKDDEKPGFTGYDISKRWFQDFIGRIQKLPCGKIYTAHDTIKEAELRGGGTVSQLEPHWTGQCKAALDKYVTLTGFIFKETATTRIMQIQGDRFVKANNGFSTHFLDFSTREPLISIPLGANPKQGYELFMHAFYNELALDKKGKILGIHADNPFTVDDEEEEEEEILEEL